MGNIVEQIGVVILDDPKAELERQLKFLAESDFKDTHPEKCASRVAEVKARLKAFDKEYPKSPEGLEDKAREVKEKEIAKLEKKAEPKEEPKEEPKKEEPKKVEEKKKKDK